MEIMKVFGKARIGDVKSCFMQDAECGQMSPRQIGLFCHKAQRYFDGTNLLCVVMGKCLAICGYGYYDRLIEVCFRII